MGAKRVCVSMVRGSAAFRLALNEAAARERVSLNEYCARVLIEALPADLQAWVEREEYHFERGAAATLAAVPRGSF